MSHYGLAFYRQRRARGDVTAPAFGFYGFMLTHQLKAGTVMVKWQPLREVHRSMATRARLLLRLRRKLLLVWAGMAIHTEVFLRAWKFIGFLPIHDVTGTA